MKLISGEMIGNSNGIGTKLKASILNLPPKYINLILFLQFFYINKSDRTAHFVVYYKLKELYINDSFKGKQGSEKMETELTEMDSRTENLVVSEDANVDEAIPIDLKKEQNTEAYKETMIKYINKIDSYDTEKKVNTTEWRPIYEVRYEANIKYSKMSADNFIKGCMDN